MTDKFEKETLPKILATLQRAKEGGKVARVTVEFNPDGGLNLLQLETKEKIQ